MHYQGLFLDTSKGTEHCTNITSLHDLHDTTIASRVIAALFAMLFYIAVFILSGLGACYTRCSKLLSMPATYVLFLVGALVVSVNIFSNENELDVKTYYNTGLGVVIGHIYLIVGAILFFQKPPSCTESCRPVANQPCIQHQHENLAILSRQQPSMGIVLALITVVLVVVETMLLASTVKNLESDDLINSWKFVLADEVIHLLQKIVQAGTYGFLRRFRIPSDRFKESTPFYFKVLSFYNFVMWLDSMVNSDSDVDFTKAAQSYGPWFPAIETIYKALLIDYRLLCSLLFLEHALEIQEDVNIEIEGINPPASPGEDEDLDEHERYVTVSVCPMESCHLTCAGYFVGLCCLILETVLTYFSNVHAGNWMHVFYIFFNVFLVVCEVLLLNKNNLEVQDTVDKESRGIKIMVCPFQKPLHPIPTPYSGPLLIESHSLIHLLCLGALSDLLSPSPNVLDALIQRKPV